MHGALEKKMGISQINLPICLERGKQTLVCIIGSFSAYPFPPCAQSSSTVKPTSVGTTDT